MQGNTPFAYKGFNVLSWVPDGVEGKSGTWTTPLERLDVPSGAFAVTAPATHPVHGQKLLYKSQSRDLDHAPLWSFLSALLGRLTPFWCPSFQRDMDVISTTLGTLTITKVGYAALLAADPIGCKYLYVFNQNGTNAVAILATAAVDNGNGTETITYSTLVTDIASVGAASVVTLGSPDGISLLRFSRLDDDAIPQQFYTTDVIDTQVAVVSVLNEQP